MLPWTGLGVATGTKNEFHLPRPARSVPGNLKSISTQKPRSKRGFFIIIIGDSHANLSRLQS